MTEILVAIAIVSILAAVVLVSAQSYGKKARSSRAASQLTSVIPSMSACFMNGGEINDPAAGDDICTEERTYGQWPSFTGSLVNYSYTGTFDFSGPRDWYLKARSSSSYDNVTICCNSTMNSCANIGNATAACIATTTW
ncbi:MAG: hypothetical protein A3J76_03485 [Candidatus Moranbacteria bacterium RBG_13_45_13]|nr:MAG: hypothetical protein A3J76_03485 [Candidatus Moranbacteria bacterium RBG_13_45_13]